jgi:hypothetical protein
LIPLVASLNISRKRVNISIESLGTFMAIGYLTMQIGAASYARTYRGEGHRDY